MCVQAVDAVNRCIIYNPDEFFFKGFDILSRRHHIHGLDAVTDADAVLIKRFLRSLQHDQMGMYDALHVETALEDPSMMAVCQKAAKDVLARSILDQIFLVCPSCANCASQH